MWKPLFFEFKKYDIKTEVSWNKAVTHSLSVQGCFILNIYWSSGHLNVNWTKDGVHIIFLEMPFSSQIDVSVRDIADSLIFFLLIGFHYS